MKDFFRCHQITLVAYYNYEDDVFQPFAQIIPYLREMTFGIEGMAI